MTIAGVVGVVKQYRLETDGKIATYFPFEQHPGNELFLVVRTSAEEVGLSRPGNIVGLVVRQGMGLVGLGIVVGLAGSAALTRVMASLLFGVRATDVATFAAVPVLLAAVAFAATAIPAWRATRVDPIVVLREE